MAIGENIFAISGRMPALLTALPLPNGNGVSGQGPVDTYVPPASGHPRFHGNAGEKFVPDKYNDPRHTFSAMERVELYKGLKDSYPHLLTPFTARLLRVAELMAFFTGLETAAFQYDRQEERREILSRLGELQRLTKDIVRMYTRKEVLPGFAIAKMVNLAYAGKDAVAVLMDYDFTSVNHFDKTDSLGDELVLAIGDSLWDALRNEKAVKFLKEKAVRVRYPQRSAFLVVGESERVKELLNAGYVEIEQKIYKRLKRAQRKGRIAQEVELDAFRLSTISHDTSVKLSQFKDGLRSRKISEAQVVEFIFKELKRLSGEATFIKARSRKKTDPAKRVSATMVQGGVSVYDSSVLPPSGSALWDSLMEFVEKGRGFVPLGKFGPALLEEVKEIRRALTWNDYNHTVGAITRDTRFGGGGALEDVERDIKRFMGSPVQAGNGAFEIFKNKVRHLCLLLLNVGEETRRNDRAPHFMNADKVWQEGEINDFFVEQTGLMQTAVSKDAGRPIKLDLFFVVEVDDGKAHDLAWPIRDNVDASFQMNGWKVYTTYSDKGGYPIVGGALGDQMWFSASLEKRDGTRFVPEQILGAVQECAKAYFIERGEIYQVFAKIEMPDGTIERLPVWIVQGQAVASDGYPANAVKAQKYETLTIVFTDMPDINAPDAAMHIKHIRRLLLSYVAELKRKRGWRKEGLEKLPPNYVNGGSGKAGPDVGGIKIYDPKGRLDGGVVRDRGWRGAEAGVAPPSTIGGRSSVPDEEGLRRAKGAKYSLKKARRELRYSKKK